MNGCVTARSLSRPVWQRIQLASLPVRVRAVFGHACNLATPDGWVVALVLPQVGNGPLNVVVDGLSDGFGPVEPGMPAVLERSRIRVGGLDVTLENALVWEPCPDWRKLRGHEDAFSHRLPLVHTLAQRHAPEGSFLPLVSERAGGPTSSPQSEPAGSTSDVVHAVALKVLAMLRVGWEGDAALLQMAAAQLAGLGNGLTPAGDDFLGGTMLWAWLALSTPRSLCRVLAEAAAPRTTALSAALLHAAARGECSAAWHALLAALCQGTDVELAKAARAVLAHGATSGADALAGFLWAGLRAPS